MQQALGIEFKRPLRVAATALLSLLQFKTLSRRGELGWTCSLSGTSSASEDFGRTCTTFCKRRDPGEYKAIAVPVNPFTSAVIGCCSFTVPRNFNTLERAKYLNALLMSPTFFGTVGGHLMLSNDLISTTFCGRRGPSRNNTSAENS